MDLFTQVGGEFSAPKDLSAKVQELGEFVAGLSESEITVVRNLQKSRDFESWEKAARAAQAFAYEQGLRERWWEVVHQLDKKRRESFWTPAWDSAYDYGVALLLKPWVGVTWPSKNQEILISPLRSLGLDLA